MTGQPLGAFLRHLKQRVGSRADGDPSDDQLLARFARLGDETAFELLVWRHAGVVVQVARRLLRRAEDVEDVFQATFLTLARKAGSIRRRGALASWLHRVAYRVALRARAGAARHRGGSPLGELPALPAADGPVWRDLRLVLDEEINRLPEKYRLPVVLCYLEGRTLEQAARQLDCPKGTVCSRLAEARQRLRARLTRRGLTLSGAGLALLLSSRDVHAVTPHLVAAAACAAVRFGSGKAAGASVAPSAVILAEGVLRTMGLTKLRIAAVVLVALALGATGVGLFADRVMAEKPAAAPTLVPGTPAALRVPPELLTRVGIQTAEVRARPAAPVRSLELTGSLAMDPDRLARVRSRCPGEVTEIGHATGDGRPLHVGDRVKKGQVLAVVWSKDLGEKKSELLDAILQQRLDKETLDRLERAFTEGTIPEGTYRAARRTHEADVNAVARAERTLRVWRAPDDEIQAVKDEAERLARRKGKRDREEEKNWARCEVRAPLDGTIVEKNVNVGEVVKTTVLFQVADLGRLAVLVQAPEADAAALRALTPEQRRWTVLPASDPDSAPVEGRIEQIGTVIDPNTGTLAVKGSVPNRDGLLMPGQFVRVTVPLPRGTREVVIPASALVDDGKDHQVFVQPDPRKFQYVPRRVRVVRRSRDVVHVRSPLTPEEEREGFESLRPGERIVTAGAVELSALWADLKERPQP
jgi:cobalt-zinc-cadmium efflux system membrane fusion protein